MTYAKGTYLRAKEDYVSPLTDSKAFTKAPLIRAGDIGMVESYGMFIDGKPRVVRLMMLRAGKTLSFSPTDLALRWEKVA